LSDSCLALGTFLRAFLLLAYRDENRDTRGRRQTREEDKVEKEGWWFGAHLADFYDFLTSDCAIMGILTLIHQYKSERK
jgi:hypothetical protein